MNREKTSVKRRSEVQGTHIATSAEFSQVDRREISPAAFAMWIRQLLQNWRQGTVAVKGRADVSLSGKKPWKQKGTGRARAGTAKSPLWRKGGVIHGPQPRVRTLKINKKQKSGTLNSLFWNFIDQGNIHIIRDSFEGDRPKTALAYNLLKQADLHNKKVVVFVSPMDVLSYASFVNIPNVQVVYFDEANAFDLAGAHCWLVFQKDLETFKQMVAQWL